VQSETYRWGRRGKKAHQFFKLRGHGCSAVVFAALLGREAVESNMRYWVGLSFAL
jgi:hypothetical protein